MQRLPYAAGSSPEAAKGAANSSQIGFLLIVGAVIIAAVTALVVVLDHWK
jgi:hypothetical protein